MEVREPVLPGVDAKAQVKMALSRNIPRGERGADNK